MMTYKYIKRQFRGAQYLSANEAPIRSDTANKGLINIKLGERLEDNTSYYLLKQVQQL